MARKTSMLLAVAASASLWLGSRADADVIGAFIGCAPWETAVVAHGAAICRPRACTSDGECSGGRCESRRACIVSTEVWVTPPGPCVDRDRDGACDGRTRETREVERGECRDDRPCEGTCRTIRACHAP